MNKQDLSGQHLELKNVDKTWFRSPINGERHSVKDAPPEVFDAWITQYVEDIQNIDRGVWSIHHRWNIINAVLAEGLLVITRLASGDKLERPLEVNSETQEEEKSAYRKSVWVGSKSSHGTE